MKSLFVAYILWFFFGLFGVHHFYLRRDRHAFVSWATLGGVFGLGWLRDLFHMSNYVDDANDEEEEIWADNEGRLHQQDGRRMAGGPRVSGTRFAGMLVMGYIFGTLSLFSCPQEWFDKEKRPYKYLIGLFLLIVPPLAVAVGVHLVASIGRLQASFQWCLLGSALGVIWTLEDPTNIGFCVLLSAIAARLKGISWRPPKRRKGVCKRITILFTFGSIYFLLWGSVLYYNATITTSDGESIPLREAVNNFFTSPAWKDTKEAIYTIWQHIQVNGWRNVYDQLMRAIDPEGEANAYKVLGVSSSATQEEIKKAYKTLAKEWHPDKHTDPDKKLEAQEKFLQIQKAYEILSKVKSRRHQQNKKSSQNVYKDRDEF